MWRFLRSNMSGWRAITGSHRISAMHPIPNRRASWRTCAATLNAIWRCCYSPTLPSPGHRLTCGPPTPRPGRGASRSMPLAIIGPAGTGKSHTLIGLGIATIHAGHKARYFTAADLVETLYRGLADNTVGKIIESLLRVDLIILDELGFAPLDDTATQLLFRLVAGAYERRSLAIASHWPFEQWGRFLPEQTTAVSILDRLLHHATVVITDGQSYRMKDAQHRKENP